MRVDCKKSLIRNESVLERDFKITRKSFSVLFLHILCSPLSNSDSNGDVIEVACMKYDLLDPASNRSKNEECLPTRVLVNSPLNPRRDNSHLRSSNSILSSPSNKLRVYGATRAIHKTNAAERPTPSIMSKSTRPYSI
jgi:hypothetical protein